METIAIAAHKGGAGKTTVAVNLADVLAAEGMRVLVVDTDPQGAAAAALGVPVSKPTIYEAMAGEAGVLEVILGTAVDGLAILPADLDLAGAEVELPRGNGWQRSLARLLAPLEQVCDLVIVDTPPGHGVLSVCALTAATAALAVCPPEFLAYRALPHLMDMAAHAGARVLGVAPTLVARGSRHGREVLEAIREDYSELALAEIPRRIALADAALAGTPIRRFAPRSDAAAAFEHLADQVRQRVAALPA